MAVGKLGGDFRQAVECPSLELRSELGQQCRLTPAYPPC
jgi:hypothetical protein